MRDNTAFEKLWLANKGHRYPVRWTTAPDTRRFSAVVRKYAVDKQGRMTEFNIARIPFATEVHYYADTEDTKQRFQAALAKVVLL